MERDPQTDERGVRGRSEGRRVRSGRGAASRSRGAGGLAALGVLLGLTFLVTTGATAQTTTVTEVYAHDAAGRLVRVERTVEGETSVTGFEWDDNGNLRSRVVDVGAILLDGFESGDTAAWMAGRSVAPGSGPASSTATEEAATAAARSPRRSTEVAAPEGESGR